MVWQASKAECVVLLENVRFHKGETKNDPAFAEKVRKVMWASLGQKPAGESIPGQMLARQIQLMHQ